MIATALGLLLLGAGLACGAVAVMLWQKRRRPKIINVMRISVPDASTFRPAATRRSSAGSR